MMRPMVATAAVTAAVVLLAGCGGDDKKSDAKPGGGESSAQATPSAPPVASFDPPKGFAADIRHIEAIKLRHYFGMIEVDLKRRPSADLAADLSRYFRDLLPLMTWLRGAVKEEQR